MDNVSNPNITRITGLRHSFTSVTWKYIDHQSFSVNQDSLFISTKSMLRGCALYFALNKREQREKALENANRTGGVTEWGKAGGFQ